MAIDKIQKNLEDRYLNKKFKYYGINGVSNWIANTINVGYVTSCTKNEEVIKPYIISDIGLMYYVEEIIIIN